MENSEFWYENSPKNYERKIIRKITHQNRNQHITMCPCNKFQSVWRTLDFSTKLVQKNMTDKTFEKQHQNRNKHIVMYPCTKCQSIW